MTMRWADPKEWAASMTDRPANCHKHPGAVQLLVGDCATCYEIYMSGLHARIGLLRFTVAKRKRTRGNVYNYNYWECPHCRWHPGGSEGPPGEFCRNCKRSLYTDDPEKATMLIRLTRDGHCYSFEIVDFKRIEQT